MTSIRRLPPFVALFGMLPLSGIASGQCQVAGLTADQPWFESAYGGAVGISGDLAVIGQVNADDLGENSGAAEVLRYVGGTWQFETRLLPPGAMDYWKFGTSVAIEGNVIVVGAPGNPNVGAIHNNVFVFRHDGVAWQQEQNIQPFDGALGDNFGAAVAVSGDLILVGAAGRDEIGSNSGAVYAYRFDGANWNFEQKILPNDQALFKAFGGSLSIDGSRTLQQTLVAPEGSDPLAFGAGVAIRGDLAVVGVPGYDGPDYTDQGAVHVYRFDEAGQVWMHEQMLVGSLDSWGSAFGRAIDLGSGRIFVGTRASGGGGLGESGPAGAYVFDYDPQSASWGESQLLELGFGTNRIAVAAHGDRVIVGNPDVDIVCEYAGLNGAARVYQYNAQSEMWEIEADLLAQIPGGYDRLGHGVDIDQSRAIVGLTQTYWAGPLGAGRALIFRRDGETWTLEAELAPLDDDLGHEFGAEVAIDGEYAMVTAPNAHDGRGAAYVFRFDGAEWVQLSKIWHPDGAGAPVARFGDALALDGDHAFIGAPADGDGKTSPGSTYVVPGIKGNDCDDNGMVDACEIIDDPSLDINGTGILDVCELLGDLNGDGVTDTLDLLALLTTWGECPDEGPCPGDIDGDGVVGILDLLVILGNWS